MSLRPTKNVFLAGLSLAMMWSSHMVQVVESQACTVLNVYGSNGVIGAGFGVEKSGQVPRSGGSGDAGADATHFSGGLNPQSTCGAVALLHGKVNIAQESAKVVKAARVWPNGSIPLDVFQVNRNGGGPGMAEVSMDATGNSFSPADVTLNLPGNFGLYDANRRTLRVVVTLKEGTVCTGGKSRNLCLIRFMAGQDPNKQQQTCGGCFLVELDGKVVRSSKAVSTSASYSLSPRQLQEVTALTVKLAKENNMVDTTPRHKKRGHHQ